MSRRLMWLGHLARMPEHRIPKSVLFGWLSQPRPQGGPRRRWRDVIRKDLKEMKISEEDWYEEARQSRARWRAMCWIGIEEFREAQQSRSQSSSVRNVVCDECGRAFRRESDKKRHKCLDERRKPVSQQKGAVQCGTCRKWFKSRGGLTVHACRPPGD